jgi:predicted RNase H-like HicB family nuclease
LGLVTIAGSGNDDLARRTLKSILKQAASATARRSEPVQRYLILIEPTASGFSAYSPDLQDCVATGVTRADVEQNMRDAVELHLEGLRENGELVPPPSTFAAYVEVAA